MRKMFLFMMVSADGYFEGVDHDINWHNVDAEFQEFANKQLDATSTLVFGGRTYNLMASFWPSDAAVKADPETASRMNSMQKIVFSHKLKSVDWNNTELHTTDVSRTIKRLKQETGKDIAVFGSSDLCVTLLKEKLLDEIRLMVNPVLLGEGTSLFHGLNQTFKLQKTDSRTFNSGNVLLTYRVLYK